MFHRDSSLVIMYSLMDRKQESLIPLMKKHIVRGSTVFSDSASMYINLKTQESHICKLLDCNHFYINHNAYDYAHFKFPFVHTMHIESSWGNLKRQSPRLIAVNKKYVVQMICDAYCMRQVLKVQSMPEFIRKCLCYYGQQLTEEFFEQHNYKEVIHYPNFQHFSAYDHLKQSATLQKYQNLSNLNLWSKIQFIDFSQLQPSTENSDIDKQLLRTEKLNLTREQNSLKHKIPIGFSLDHDQYYRDEQKVRDNYMDRQLNYKYPEYEQLQLSSMYLSNERQKVWVTIKQSKNQNNIEENQQKRIDLLIQKNKKQEMILRQYKKEIISNNKLINCLRNLGL